jgi:hypothetical protein
MEYLKMRRPFAHIPLAAILATWRKSRPQWLGNNSPVGDFALEADMVSGAAAVRDE